MGLCSSQSKNSCKLSQKESLKKCQTTCQPDTKSAPSLYRAKSSNNNSISHFHQHTQSNASVNAFMSKRKITKDPISKSYSILDKFQTYTKNDKYAKIQHNFTGKVRTSRTLIKEKENQEMEQFICNAIGNTFTSPHIANILEVFQDSQNYFIIQDFCNGGLLNQKCGQFLESEIFYILSQILEIFEQIHSQNCAHGNLTIQSFALLDQTNNYYVKLIDILPLFQVKSQQELLELQLQDLKSIGQIIYQLQTDKLLTSSQIQTLIYKQRENISEWHQIILQLLQTNDLNVYQTIKSNQIFKNAISLQLAKFTGGILQMKKKKASYLQERLLLIMNSIFFKERQQFIENIFKKSDENGNGSLSKSELQKTLGDDENFDRIFEQLDNDGNGEIDIDEFLFHTCDRGALLTEFNLESTFQQLQKKGYIGTFQICKFLESDLEKLQSDFEEAGCSKVNQFQFKKLMKSLL